MVIDALVEPTEKMAGNEVKKLSQLDTDALYIELGKIALANREPGVSPNTFSYRSGEEGEYAGAFREFGQRVFAAWKRALHDLVCGEDAVAREARSKLLRAIADKGDVATIVTVILTSYLGLNVALAAAIALIANQVIFRPFGVEFCKFWSTAA